MHLQHGIRSCPSASASTSPILPRRVRPGLGPEDTSATLRPSRFCGSAIIRPSKRPPRSHQSQSLFGWIGPKTLVQPHEWTAFLLRRVAVHIYHLTTANLLKSRTPIITGVTPIIACLTSETQQNRL